MSTLLEARGITKAFPGVRALEGVNLRVAAIVPTQPPPLATPPGGGAPQGLCGVREVYFYGQGRVRAPVYPRAEIAAGARGVPGPAILVDAWTTIVVYPGQRLRCDGLGCAWIEPA